ncbi:MAG: hypothetical protein LBD07_02435 [Spirochaetaceae bacterium]|jgi:hypothetical protein|nr:hypothetical protein [Spirochaetaceae bacterium]
MTTELFKRIKEKHGKYASWAVWADAGSTPKSNVDDLSIFDIEKNPQILEKLNQNIILVGLNCADSPLGKEAFSNFHPKSSTANDFKIRYAFKGTEYWGAYMTDIIKGCHITEQEKLEKYLKEHPEVVTKNIEIFKQELLDIESKEPLLIAFGGDVYDLLKNHGFVNAYKITHYSYHYEGMSDKDAYRMKVLEQLRDVPKKP